MTYILEVGIAMAVAVVLLSVIVTLFAVLVATNRAQRRPKSKC